MGFVHEMAGWMCVGGALMAGTLFGEELTFMSYNICAGLGMDRKRELTRAAEVIKREQAEWVAVQEVDCCTRRSSGIDQPEVLARLTGLHATFGKAIDFQGGGYGILLLTKEKPLATKTIPLPSKFENRALLIAEFERLVMCVTHLSLNERERIDSVKLIREALKDYRKPIVIAGDWNDKPDSETLKAFGTLFTVLNDVTQPTFPSPKPVQCIDYIAMDKAHAPQFTVVSRAVLDEPVVSDHRPVTLKLRR